MLRGLSLSGLALSGQSKHTGKANCSCGCVPNVFSLHEAAALRARKRQEQQAQEAEQLRRMRAFEEQISALACGAADSDEDDGVPVDTVEPLPPGPTAEQARKLTAFKEQMAALASSANTSDRDATSKAVPELPAAGSADDLPARPR